MGNEGMSAGQLLKQANQLKRAGRLDEAIALYYQAIEINPSFAWAYHNLGDAFVKQGKLDEAIVEYQKAIEINPNSAWFLRCLEKTLVERAELESATQDLHKAMVIKSDNAGVNELDKISSQPGYSHNTNEIVEKQTKYFEINQHTQVIKGRYGYYMLNTHSPIGRALLFYGEHAQNELSIMKDYIPEGTTVFDIGAHQGTHTLAFARFVGSSGKVVAFEPQRTMYQIASGTIALNELYNVLLFNFAVGNKREIVSIPIFDYKKPGHFSGMSITNEPNGEKVIQEKIDSLALELDFGSNLSLIKIDVEGMEYQVLTGAEEVISQNKPTIFFELHEGNKYRSQILDFLKRHGYKIFESVTRGFNPNNYFGHQEDRFKGGVDHNALAIPVKRKEQLKAVELKEFV